jgi:AcrR family transcriptional regulator
MLDPLMPDIPVPGHAPAPRSSNLDEETIVATAMALAERDGSDALTMRRLGAALGVDPTAVYRHFRDKQALIAAVAERLFERAQDDVVETSDWRANLRALLLAGRRLYRDHPAIALGLARQREDTPALTRATEFFLRNLRAAGLPDGDAALAYHACIDCIVGAGLMHALAPYDRGEGDTVRRALGALSPETHPNTVAVARHLYPGEDHVFTFTVELLLDAIELQAARTAASTKEEVG